MSQNKCRSTCGCAHAHCFEHGVGCGYAAYVQPSSPSHCPITLQPSELTCPTCTCTVHSPYTLSHSSLIAHHSPICLICYFLVVPLLGVTAPLEITLNHVLGHAEVLGLLQQVIQLGISGRVWTTRLGTAGQAGAQPGAAVWQMFLRLPSQR